MAALQQPGVTAEDLLDLAGKPFAHIDIYARNAKLLEWLCDGNGSDAAVCRVRWRMTISFARHQFPPAIIRHAVWLYVRFTLSYRDVEDLLAERGLDVFYETVRRWVLKFGPLFARTAPPTPTADIAMASR
jgi:hypothetical protein